ncbi:MAG: tRNA epoxyqueuosine(34) reductase QueG [Pirellulaceae bacterium]
MSLSPQQLSAQIRTDAVELGFNSVGICPAVTPTGIDHFHQWLDAGYGGQMHYLEARRAAYAHPRHVLDGVQSIVMLTLGYRTEAPEEPGPGAGRISKYAWGEVDYHDLIHARLKQFKQRILAACPEASVRGVVDTAPLLEREFAQLAGLGWIGKNTLLLNRQAGSLFFLAAILLDQPLDYDDPHTTDHCGTCTACLDACPTDAFVEPYVLDATRCISYLTIELRDPIPRELRAGIGDWLFGCDVCQDVCPWNRKAPLSEIAEFQPPAGNNPIELRSLFDLDDETFRTRFRKSPLWRPRRRGILRNAAIVLGNQPAEASIAALRKGLDDAEELIRGASAWALGQHASPGVAEILKRRREIEPVADVREEIKLALEELATTGQH